MYNCYSREELIMWSGCCVVVYRWNTREDFIYILYIQERKYRQKKKTDSDSGQQKEPGVCGHDASVPKARS